MEAKITIKNNSLRLLSRFFLHLVPLDHLNVSERDTYTCMVENIGNVGIIECARVHIIDLGDIKESLNMLCDNLIDFREEYRRAGFFNTSKVQLCYFYFIRRNDAAFSALLKKELKEININISPPPSLFDQPINN